VGDHAAVGAAGGDQAVEVLVAGLAVPRRAHAGHSSAKLDLDHTAALPAGLILCHAGMYRCVTAPMEPPTSANYGWTGLAWSVLRKAVSVMRRLLVAASLAHLALTRFRVGGYVGTSIADLAGALD
jgi:hypothetical protein